jgi:hypothetical protein
MQWQEATDRTRVLGLFVECDDASFQVLQHGVTHLEAACKAEWRAAVEPHRHFFKEDTNRRGTEEAHSVLSRQFIHRKVNYAAEQRLLREKRTPVA